MITQLRFFVLVGLAAIIVCGVAVFYTHRSPRGATSPTEAELNTTAQKYFEQQGSAEQLRNPSRAGTLEACKQAFKKGYTTGFKKTHPQK